MVYTWFRIEVIISPSSRSKLRINRKYDRKNINSGCRRKTPSGGKAKKEMEQNKLVIYVYIYIYIYTYIYIYIYIS